MRSGAFEDSVFNQRLRSVFGARSCVRSGTAQSSDGFEKAHSENARSLPTCRVRVPGGDKDGQRIRYPHPRPKNDCFAYLVYAYSI